METNYKAFEEGMEIKESSWIAIHINEINNNKNNKIEVVFYDPNQTQYDELTFKEFAQLYFDENIQTSKD